MSTWEILIGEVVYPADACHGPPEVNILMCYDKSDKSAQITISLATVIGTCQAILRAPPIFRFSLRLGNFQVRTSRGRFSDDHSLHRPPSIETVS